MALHLKAHFGSHRPDRISEFTAQSYRKARRDARAADRTINRELAALSHQLRSAVRWGWIKRDDVPQIDRAREGQGRIIALSDRQCRAVIAAGLDDKVVTPHVMRHTAVTRLVRAGADIPTILKISGHKTVSMVLRYAHVDAAHIDAAASALDLSSGGKIHPEFTARPDGSVATAA